MKIIAWLLAFVGTVLIIAFSFKSEIRDYLFRDNIIVRPTGVLLNSVKIDRVGESGGDTLIIFSESIQQQNKVSKPGFNKFIVSADGVELAEFEHFVSSAISKHDYVFELHRQQDSVFVKLQIFGPDQQR